MTSSELRQIFEQVVDLPLAEQTARLDDLCPDPEQRRQIAELLAADHAVHDVLDHPELRAEPSLAGSTFGSFRIVGLLGRGGMGSVYEAEQIDPPRSVALKVLHGGVPDADRLARFRREAAFLARLEHPGIVRLYEVGSCEVGGQTVPYLALELVRDAEILTEHAARTALPLRPRLELFARICDAVAFGHEHGVVHRDLKPGNILVDAEGRPHIVDFGIARALHADSSLATLTGTHQLVGTPSYMSPEQLRPGTHHVDLRSDVWSLGVVLYELLTNHHPFAAPDDSLTEIARAIEEREPIRLGRRDAALRGDLEIIVECALRKQPAERYASAGELGAEIARVLANEPIMARRDHALYVLRKRMARHRLLLATAGAIVVGSAAAALAMSVLWRRAADAHAAGERSLYFSRIAQAAYSFEAGRFAEMKQTLRECDERHRDWEWGHLHARSDDAVWHAPFAGDTVSVGGDAHRNTVHGLAVSPDGTVVAVAHRNHLISLLDAKDGRLRRELRGHNGVVGAVAFMPGQPVRLLSSSADKTVRCWDVEAGNPVREWRHDDEVWAFAAAGDGSWFATGDRRGFLRIVDTVNGGICDSGLAHRGGVTAITGSRDGRHIATAGYDLTIAIWDAGSGKLVRRIEKSMQRQRNGTRDIFVHGQPIQGLAFHPTGNFLFSASQDGFGKMWDVATGDLMFFESMGWPQGQMAVSPDGEALGIAGNDMVRLRHTVEGRALEPLRGHDLVGGSIAFTPDNKLVLAGAADGSVRAYERSRRSGAHFFAQHAAKAWHLAVSGDRATLASGDGSGIVKTFRTADLRPLRSLAAHRGIMRGIALNGDGSRLLTAGDDRFVRLWDTATGARLVEAKAPANPFVAWRGNTMLLAGQANEVLVLGELDLAAARRLLLGTHATAMTIAENGLVALGSDRGTISLWDATTAMKLAEWAAHDGARVSAIRFLTDGQLASAGTDSTVRTWSVPEGVPHSIANVGHVVSIAETPSANRLIVCPMRDNPRVLLRENLKTLIELVGHEPGSFLCGIVSLGDGRFVTGDSQGALRVWTDRPLRPR